MSLSSNFLNQWCEKNIKRNRFIGVFPINLLPSTTKRPCGFIVNTDSSNLPGQHWIAVVLTRDGRGEVFDSFGELPPSELCIWMNKHCVSGWTFSKNFIQNIYSKLCGSYCLFNLYNRLERDRSPANVIKRLHVVSDVALRKFYQ